MKRFKAFFSLLLGVSCLTANAQTSDVVALDRSGWTIVGVSSDCVDSGTDNGRIAKIIDGDASTYWHSNYKGVNGSGVSGQNIYPQCFVIDLGQVEEFNAIGYTSRPGNANGYVTSFKFFVSETPFSVSLPFTSANGSANTVRAMTGEALSGEFSFINNANPALERRWASPTTMRGRYVMFVVLSGSGGLSSCAEFNIYKGNPADVMNETLDKYISSYITEDEKSLPATYLGGHGTLRLARESEDIELKNTTAGLFNPSVIDLPEAGRIYRVINAFSGFETNENGDGNKEAIYRNGNNLCWQASDGEHIDQLWTITPVDGGYNMQAVTDNASVGIQTVQDNAFPMVSALNQPGLLKITSLRTDNGGYCQFNLKTEGSRASFHCGGHNNGAGISGNVVPWNGAAGGASAWYIKDVTVERTAAAKKYYIDQLTSGSFDFGTAIGQNAGTEEGVAVAKELIENEETSFADARDAYFSVTSLNMPQDGRIYRIINAGNFSERKAIYCNFGSNQLKWKTEDADDLDQLWTLTSVDGGYAMQTVKTASYVGPQAASNQPHPMTEDATVLTLGTFGDRQFSLKIVGSRAMLHAGLHGGGSGNDGTVMAYDSNKNSFSAWTIEDVTEEMTPAVRAYYTEQLSEGMLRAVQRLEAPRNTIAGTANDFATIREAYFGNQPTEAERTAFSTESKYRMQVITHGTWLTSNKENQKFWAQTAGARALEQVWTVEKHEGNFYLKNAGTGLYAGAVAQGTNFQTPMTENRNARFTFNISEAATDDSPATFHLFTGGKQVHVEAAGNINSWSAGNVLFRLDPVGPEIVEKLVTIDEAYETLGREFPVLAEGVDNSSVIWPGEFSFKGLESNFELLAHAATAVESAADADMIVARDNLSNFISNSEAYGYPRSVVCNVPAVDYSTIYMPFNTSCPEGITLYFCENIEDDGYTLALTQADNLQSNRAYIMAVGDDVKGNTYQFIGYGNQQGNQDNSGSLLKGTHTGCAAPAGSYVLQNQQGVLGFYRVAEGKTINVPAHKCYLQLPEGQQSAGIRRLLFPDGMLTSIDAVDASAPASSSAYDLSGRRVRTASRGLYIVGGKKVLVK